MGGGADLWSVHCLGDTNTCGNRNGYSCYLTAARRRWGQFFSRVSRAGGSVIVIVFDFCIFTMRSMTFFQQGRGGSHLCLLSVAHINLRSEPAQPRLSASTIPIVASTRWTTHALNPIICLVCFPFHLFGSFAVCLFSVSSS